MEFHGINKLTLLDFPKLTATTLFTGGCNFRCPFCHNGSLVLNPKSQPTIAEEEIFAYLNKRKGMIDGVCITGGEPTLQKDLKEFIKKVKEMGFLVKLDTNGTNPALVKELLNENLLDYIAMDIKTSLENYSNAVGIANYDTSSIKESIYIIMNSGIDYEFRTTVVKDIVTENDIRSISKTIKGAKNYYLQNFVDSGDLISENMQGESKENMQKFLEIALPSVKNAGIRGI